MGREALCVCRWGDADAEIKAVLESDTLILRGDLKRRVALTDLVGVRVEGESLTFTVDATPVTLFLGAEEAGRWLKKIATPPPSLRQKLGLSREAKALVLGAVESTPLAEALANARAEGPDQASLIVVLAEDEPILDQALSFRPRLPAGAAIWVVHGKGRTAAFGERAARDAMRDRGYIDTKVAAVSPNLSATRYVPRR